MGDEVQCVINVVLKLNFCPVIPQFCRFLFYFCRQSWFNSIFHTFTSPPHSMPPLLTFQFLIGMIVTILTDMIHIGIFYPMGDSLIDRARDTFRFSVGMAILSLLLKPVSCFFVYQMYRERGGDYNVNFGEWIFRGGKYGEGGGGGL